MNKKIILLISLLLTLSLTACSKETIIDVIIKDNEDNLNYLTVLDNGKDKTIDAFSSDEFNKYSVDCTRFTHEIKNNEIYIGAEKSKVYDEDGNEVDKPIINKLILKAINDIHHDIYYFDIYELDERYFAFIKLNVNMSDPCYLYEYDVVNDKLIELIVWQDVDLVGLNLSQDNK